MNGACGGALRGDLSVTFTKSKSSSGGIGVNVAGVDLYHSYTAGHSKSKGVTVSFKQPGKCGRFYKGWLLLQTAYIYRVVGVWHGVAPGSNPKHPQPMLRVTHTLIGHGYTGEVTGIVGVRKCN